MLTSLNDDFDTAVSVNDFANQSFYPLECSNNRVTALLTLTKGSAIHEETHPLDCQISNCELLVIEGSCQLPQKTLTSGAYVRLPDIRNSHITALSDCVLFVKFNQLLDGDTGERSIDTNDKSKWLPGPVDGTFIIPLHVYDTESIMLLRWQHAAEFRPRLNPRGEEILVMNGLLQNRDHLYRQYSWIRNPIEDWRKWHGNTGTLIYYKSGHFPDDPLRDS